MDAYLKKAMRIHEETSVVDAHLDLAFEIYNRNKVGESSVIKKYYYDHFKKAGIKIVISSLFIPDIYLPEMALRMALDQINALVEDIKSSEDEVMLVQNRKDLDTVLSEDKIGILMAFEGLDPIMNDIGLLNIFYTLGVRGAGLVWNRRNYVADGNFLRESEKSTAGGLTKWGIDVIQRLEEISMFIDVSHLNDEGFNDVLRFAKKPFTASHSNARTIHAIQRNLTDQQIRSIAERGGIIGINAERSIVGIHNNQEAIQRIGDHVDHMMSLIGSKHVGLGLDLCDGGTQTELRFGNKKKRSEDGLAHHGETVLITQELLKRGYSEQAIQDILGRNFIDFLKQFLK